MREIKFRAKEKWQKKEWFYGYYIPGNERQTIHATIFTYNSDIQNYSINDVDEKTLGQFTGLLDKSGKEIYEGDIINANFNMSKWYRMNVTWRDGGFCLNNKREEKEYMCIMQRSVGDWGLEVIGNKWDNPKLMDDNS